MKKLKALFGLVSKEPADKKGDDAVGETKIKPGNMVTIPLGEADMPKARALANRIIDLLEREGIAPIPETLVALMMIASEHAPLATSEVISKESMEAIVEKAKAEAGLNVPKKDKDGNPIFMAAPPKMMQ